MRKIICCFVFLFTILSAHSQNWSPVHFQSKYNYKIDGEDFITHTIWIDSVSVTGNDSIYYLNRIVKTNNACDSILSIALADEIQYYYTEYCNLCRGKKNLPQFLQRKFISYPNGLYHFRDTSSFIIDVQATVNESWVFDTLNSITAQITAMGIDTLFGFPDSVKTILLDNSDTIIISKNNGIILFPDFSNPGIYYRLAGMENPDKGEIVPGFWQMYDYEIGTIICYQNNSSTGEASYEK